MPPQTVRTPTKKAISALPETSRLNFLAAASKLLADSSPELSSYLGSRALQWADKKKLPAPRISGGQLCYQCGAYCTVTDAAFAKLSSQSRHRRRHQSVVKSRGPEHTIAAVFGCKVCSARLVRTFATEDDAQRVFPSTKIQSRSRQGLTRPAAAAAAAQNDQRATTKSVLRGPSTGSALHLKPDATHEVVQPHSHSSTSAPVYRQQLVRHQHIANDVQRADPATLETSLSPAPPAGSTTFAEATQPLTGHTPSPMLAKQQHMLSKGQQQVPLPDGEQAQPADQQQLQIPSEVQAQPAGQQQVQFSSEEQAQSAGQPQVSLLDEGQAQSDGQQQAPSLDKEQAQPAGQQQVSVPDAEQAQPAGQHEEPLPDKQEAQPVGQQQEPPETPLDMPRQASQSLLNIPLEPESASSEQSPPNALLVHSMLPVHQATQQQTGIFQLLSSGTALHLDDPPFAISIDAKADPASLLDASKSERHAETSATALVFEREHNMADKVSVEQLPQSTSDEGSSGRSKRVWVDRTREPSENNVDQQTSVLNPKEESSVHIIPGRNATQQAVTVNSPPVASSQFPVEPNALIFAGQSKPRSIKSANFSWQRFGRSWVPQKKRRQK